MLSIQMINRKATSKDFKQKTNKITQYKIWDQRKTIEENVEAGEHTGFDCNSKILGGQKSYI